MLPLCLIGDFKIFAGDGWLRKVIAKTSKTRIQTPDGKTREGNFS